MGDREMPLSSDESDADYVPEGVTEELSEEESGNESDIGDKGDESLENKPSKSKDKRKKRANEDKVMEKEKVEEKTDLDVNKLWAEFQEDVDKIKTKPEHSKVEEVKKEQKVSAKSLVTEAPAVKKPRLGLGPGKPSGGLSSLLSQIGKKNKLSTLEKSKQDWLNFKQNEGIEEDIKTHNKGKDGYLEKQDFLQRSDLRQFEIEKQLRATKRSNR